MRGRRRVRRATSPAGPPRPGARPGLGVGAIPAPAPTSGRLHPCPRSPRRRRVPPRGAPPSSTSRGGEGPRPALDLLIWDAPEHRHDPLDGDRGAADGGDPAAVRRHRGVVRRGRRRSPGRRAPRTSRRACSPTSRRWPARSSAGWRRCAGSATRCSPGPRPSPTTTSTRAMLDHIAVRAHSHLLRRLVVFSGDGRNFAEPLEDLVRAGHRGRRGRLQRGGRLRDRSDLLRVHRHRGRPRRVRRAAGRVRLDALPADGAWLRPTRSLRDLVSSFTARRSN